MGREVFPKEVLTKEFLSQFKSEDDVRRFLKDLHSQVLEELLQGEFEPIVVPKHKSRALSLSDWFSHLTSKG